MRKQFLAGSVYFFNNYSGYTPHDLDYVVIDDNLPEVYMHHYDQIAKIDYFMWKKQTPQWHIDFTLHKGSFALDATRFLIPGVAKELGITIEDLKLMKDVFNQIESQVGPKYRYSKMIYDFYVENNDFVLTDEQRFKAYKEYKKYR